MMRAHKIRLNPTPEQVVYLRKAVGTARFVYNWGLARLKAHKVQHSGEAYGVMALKKEFNAIKYEQFPWVDGVTKSACAFACCATGTQQRISRQKRCAWLSPKSLAVGDGYLDVSAWTECKDPITGGSGRNVYLIRD